MAGFAWNEDWTQYYWHEDDHAYTEEGLREWIHNYAGTGMKDFVMNPNGQRTSYRGKARGFMSEGYDPNDPDLDHWFSKLPVKLWTGEGERPLAHNLWLLDKRGLNQYSIWTDECRKVGLHPWISMRMNDIHGTMDPTYYFHTEFWRSHPEMRTGTYRFQEGMSWFDATLDYACPEVREYQYELIDEFLDMYDIDGLELDLIRWAAYFRPGFQEQGIPIMNEFIKHVRGMLERKPYGHEIKLAVRVPLTPEACYGVGFDCVTWIREGWIDRIIPMMRYNGYYNGAPYEIWRRFTEGTGVELFGGLDIGIMAEAWTYCNFTSVETTRAICSSMYYKGVDGIYLFNYIPTYLKNVDTAAILNEVDDPAKLIHKHRRHLVGWDDFTAPGEPCPSMLPLELKPDVVTDVRIHLGTVAGDPASLFICLRDPKSAPPKLRLNGTECTCAGEDTLPSPCPALDNKLCGYRGGFMPGPYEDQERVRILRYEVPEGTAHDGYNMVEVTASEEETLTWVEIQLA